MATTTITVQHPHAGDYNPAPPVSPTDVLARAAGFLVAQGLVALGSPGIVDVTVAQTVATGSVTFSGCTGTVGLDLAGEPAVRVEARATDEETAQAVASELWQAGMPFTDYVSASVSGNVLTLTARVAGPFGNLVSLSPVGVGVTASGPFLSGGMQVAPTV